MALAISPRQQPVMLVGHRGGADFFAETFGPNIFTTVSKMLTDQVEPILKDPQGRLFEPLQDFCKTKARQAKERQAYYRSYPQEALSLAILSPFRIVRLSVAAFVIAEVMDYLGVLEDPQAAKERIIKAFQDANIHANIQKTTSNWWNNARRDGGILNAKTWSSPTALQQTIATWQPKHQFAVGTAVGLVFSQFVWSVAHQLGKSAVVMYVLSEANYFVAQQYGKSLTDRCKENVLVQKIDSVLNEIRQAVRRTVREPTHLKETIPEFMKHYVPRGGLPPGTKSGLLAGIIAGVVVV
jgi:hypothetical protein